MPALLTLGAAALGSVCGWWCAPLLGARSRARSWGAVAGAMAMVALEALWLGGRPAAIAVPAGFAAGLLLHATFHALLVARVARNRS
ncbi:MAG TPA: hypothetical protein VFH97_04965 [Gemmatimonadales bacterium]|nr:hypothetical protein [Gemmatimonadales bacterium]